MTDYVELLNTEYDPVCNTRRLYTHFVTSSRLITPNLMIIIDSFNYIN